MAPSTMSASSSALPASPATPLQIIAVGYRRLNKMLQELAQEVTGQAEVSVLEEGFDQAVARVRERQQIAPVDVVVAAGSNGAYLRRHLDVPVVLVKVGGFDLMQALARAQVLARQGAQSARVGLVTYEGMAPDLTPVQGLFALHIEQRSYRTEDDALQAVRELRARGVSAIVGTGTVADLADREGLHGIFLYSREAVIEALRDAVEVARAGRIQQSRLERLNAILAQLNEGVIAVDEAERVQTLNPAMARWLGLSPEQWRGRRLSEVCPDLSLADTLSLAAPELESIERVNGKPLIVNRMPIVEQGVLTGAVLSCQDPISIQRVDRQLRTRSQTRSVSARYGLDDFLGNSLASERVRQMARDCARTSATVLLLGESGTGKELVAQGIHMESDRRDLPFVAVNCAAMSDTLLESELFGYEDGAFTGARKGGKVGLFEAAHRGTIFLDEIGEMPLALQSRLLRVLQEREVLRVGATEPTPVNVRVIAATHRDLMTQVQAGRFRLDLFYRLNILRVDVPSLRERIEDVAAIAAALQRRAEDRLAGRRSGTASRLHPALMAALMAQAPFHPWPGNVRELGNVIERLLAHAPAVVQVAGFTREQARSFLQQVAPELFPSGRHGSARFLAPADASPVQAVRGDATSDRQALLALLEECGGDREALRARLGISRTTLWRRLKG